MGGGGILKTGMKPCSGDDVIKELNDVFGDPNDKDGRYAWAQVNNIFDTVKDAKIPYRALIAAYSEAGVDVCARWAAYLRHNLSDQDIIAIAQARYEALTTKPPVAIATSKHPSSGGGLTINKGKKTTIDAPEP
jgi:hypothetical protein